MVVDEAEVLVDYGHEDIEAEGVDRTAYIKNAITVNFEM